MESSSKTASRSESSARQKMSPLPHTHWWNSISHWPLSVDPHYFRISRATLRIQYGYFLKGSLIPPILPIVIGTSKMLAMFSQAWIMALVLSSLPKMEKLAKCHLTCHSTRTRPFPQEWTLSTLISPMPQQVYPNCKSCQSNKEHLVSMMNRWQLKST